MTDAIQHNAANILAISLRLFAPPLTNDAEKTPTPLTPPLVEPKK